MRQSVYNQMHTVCTLYETTGIQPGIGTLYETISILSDILYAHSLRQLVYNQVYCRHTLWRSKVIPPKIFSSVMNIP